MTTINEKIAIIDRAQEALRQHGWCQNVFQDAGGRICAVYALSIGHEEGAEIVLDDLLEEIVHDMPFPTRPAMGAISRICDFNNLEAATKDDIIAQFQITKDRLTSMANHPTNRELVNA